MASSAVREPRLAYPHIPHRSVDDWAAAHGREVLLALLSDPEKQDYGQEGNASSRQSCAVAEGVRRSKSALPETSHQVDRPYMACTDVRFSHRVLDRNPTTSSPRSVVSQVFSATCAALDTLQSSNSARSLPLSCARAHSVSEAQMRALRAPSSPPAHLTSSSLSQTLPEPPTGHAASTTQPQPRSSTVRPRVLSLPDPPRTTSATNMLSSSLVRTLQQQQQAQKSRGRSMSQSGRGSPLSSPTASSSNALLSRIHTLQQQQHLRARASPFHGRPHHALSAPHSHMHVAPGGVPEAPFGGASSALDWELPGGSPTGPSAHQFRPSCSEPQVSDVLRSPASARLVEGYNSDSGVLFRRRGRRNGFTLSAQEVMSGLRGLPELPPNALQALEAAAAVEEYISKLSPG